MTERKQGRRSAQTAEETKFQILMAATDMFCEFGYERVSLRSISERAGVSHSLIRHHFGSKEKIWFTINEKLHEYMEHYIYELIEQIPTGTPANITMYQFSIKMMAHMLLVPKPLQFIADGIRQEGEFFDYFVDKSGNIENIFLKLTDDFNQHFPEHRVNMWEQKWLMISTAHAAVSLKPMMKAIWLSSGKEPANALKTHWDIFNKQCAITYCVPKEDRLNPDTLDELLLPIAACWERAKCSEEVNKIYDHAKEIAAD